MAPPASVQSKKVKARRIKQCARCLRHNPAKQKKCVHCGNVFKRSWLGLQINKFRIFLNKLGNKTKH